MFLSVTNSLSPMPASPPSWNARALSPETSKRPIPEAFRSPRLSPCNIFLSLLSFLFVRSSVPLSFPFLYGTSLVYPRPWRRPSPKSFPFSPLFLFFPWEPSGHFSVHFPPPHVSSREIISKEEKFPGFSPFFL